MLSQGIRAKLFDGLTDIIRQRTRQFGLRANSSMWFVDLTLHQLKPFRLIGRLSR